MLKSTEDRTVETLISGVLFKCVPIIELGEVFTLSLFHTIYYYNKKLEFISPKKIRIILTNQIYHDIHAELLLNASYGNKQIPAFLEDLRIETIDSFDRFLPNSAQISQELSLQVLGELGIRYLKKERIKALIFDDDLLGQEKKFCLHREKPSVCITADVINYK